MPEVVKSWANLNYPQDRITIVMIPNGAQDGVQNLIEDEILPRTGIDLPEIIMINDGVNRGFAGGNNLGIQWAIENDFDYVFLNNGDLRLAPDSIAELVGAMESDEKIGSAQSLVKLWKDENTINTTGGMIHVAGYGYARDNGKDISEINIQDFEEIVYASGAAVMYRVDALKKIGLLEEGFFMYHEDLELGLRLKFAGFKNVIVKKSIAFHDYKFGRNPKMFEWMELYRWDVLLAYLRVPSFIVIFPLLLVIEFGVWLMAIKGGWIGSKIKACISFWSSGNLKLIVDMRRRAQSLRVIKDKDWLELVTGRIEDQGQASKLMEIINPIIDGIWKMIRKVISW